MYISKDKQRKIKLFYFGNLMNSFDSKSHNFLKSYYKKYLFEVDLIVETICKNNISNPKVLDAGGGLGIPSIILSEIFNYKSYIIDRYDEFSDEHDREVGTCDVIIDRLKSYDVLVYKENFLDNKNHSIKSSFDIVTNFSVIEHIPTSPYRVINALSSFVNQNGYLIVSTPNQAHIFNRVKLMLGKNVWEDLATFCEPGIFYGHVREYLLKELKLLINNSDNLLLSDHGGSNYAIYSFFIRKYGNKFITKGVSNILDKSIKIFPTLCLQVYVVAKVSR
jgi:2-polyprenyl-3-methyl-5-hydroxy-6-metoxy-1,4-benzoquinol methylase